MSASQKPIAAQTFGQVYEASAWKQIPSWYLRATNDQAINPALQQVFAQRMNATTREVNSSHVPFASNPSVGGDHYRSSTGHCGTCRDGVGVIAFALIELESLLTHTGL